jgi:plastocyanin
MGRCARLAVLSLPLVAAAASAAPLTEATPNLGPVPATEAGTTDFAFAHRFDVIASKVLNSPTFTLDHGILPGLAVGLHYATSSDVYRGRPNELEPYAHLALLDERRGDPLGLAVIAAYNSAANSADGAVVLERHVGPLAALASARGFTGAYGLDARAVSAAFGLRLALNRNLALVGDASHLVGATERSALEDSFRRWGWSAGVAARIPGTPHSIQVYATDVNTRTLEGTSRGTDHRWIGFSFDVPLGSLDRWKAIFVPPAEPAAAVPAAATAGPAAVPEGPTVDVAMKNGAFAPADVRVAPGTTVRWTNRDTVPHTVTVPGSWDSGTIPPGGTYTRTFEAGGDAVYTCTIHPFMHGKVTVKPGG